VNALDRLLGFTSFVLGLSGTEQKIARVLRIGESLDSSWDAESETLTLGGPGNGSGSGPSWHTLADIDFAAAPAQVFASNGAYTVGGVGVTVHGVTGSEYRDQMQIVAGVGLLLPSGLDYASDIHAIKGLTPLVHFSFAGLGLKPDTPLRCSAALASAQAGYGATNMDLVIGIEDRAVRAQSALSKCATGRCSNVEPGTPVSMFDALYGYWVIGGSEAGAGGLSLPAAGLRTVGLLLPRGIGVDQDHSYLGSTDPDTLEDPSRFVRCAEYSTVGTSQWISSSDPATLGDPENWGAFLTQGNNSAAFGTYAVCSRWKVEAYY